MQRASPDGSVLKKEIGCSRVVAWNSVCRRNEPDTVRLKHVERQQAPEKGFIPSTRLQPIAGFAHVDQDAVSPPFILSRISNSYM
jgi:hypothetical protein